MFSKRLQTSYSKRQAKTFETGTRAGEISRNRNQMEYKAVVIVAVAIAVVDINVLDVGCCCKKYAVRS